MDASLIPLGILLGAGALIVSAALAQVGLPRTGPVLSERERAEVEGARKYCLGTCRLRAGARTAARAALS